MSEQVRESDGVVTIDVLGQILQHTEDLEGVQRIGIQEVEPPLALLI